MRIRQASSRASPSFPLPIIRHMSPHTHDSPSQALFLSVHMHICKSMRAGRPFIATLYWASHWAIYLVIRWSLQNTRASIARNCMLILFTWVVFCTSYRCRPCTLLFQWYSTHHHHHHHHLHHLHHHHHLHHLHHHHYNWYLEVMSRLAPFSR
jgi:hypothetical protein